MTVAEDHRYIKEALKFTIPPARMAEEAVSPVGFGATGPNLKAFNLITLVDWQLQHQTRHATTGIWTKLDHKEQLPEKNEVSLWCQLIQHFHEVLKEEQDHSQYTGSNCDKHWRAPAPSGRGADVDGATAPILNGKSPNAAHAAASVASKVQQIFMVRIMF